MTQAEPHQPHPSRKLLLTHGGLNTCIVDVISSPSRLLHHTPSSFQTIIETLQPQLCTKHTSQSDRNTHTSHTTPPNHTKCPSSTTKASAASTSAPMSQPTDMVCVVDRGGSRSRASTASARESSPPHTHTYTNWTQHSTAFDGGRFDDGPIKGGHSDRRLLARGDTTRIHPRQRDGRTTRTA